MPAMLLTKDEPLLFLRTLAKEQSKRLRSEIGIRSSTINHGLFIHNKIVAVRIHEQKALFQQLVDGGKRYLNMNYHLLRKSCAELMVNNDAKSVP